MKHLLQLTTVAAITALTVAPAFGQTKVCIDPGHGGSDPGATGYGQQEKTNVLNTGIKFRNWLNVDTSDNNGGGSWNVLMTRTTDVFVALSGRTSYANSNGVARFMSIHNNACCGASGTETYCHTSLGTSQDLRNKIQQRSVQAWGLTNRGNKTATFYVLAYTNMPATLAELGFITHATDAAYLGNASHQDNMAKHHMYALQNHMGITAYTPSSAPPPSNPSYYFGANAQGWTNGGNNLSGPVWYTSSQWPGIIWGDQTGDDGFWFGPNTNYLGGGDPSVNVQVYPQGGSSDLHDMQLFWRTADSNFYSADKSSQKSTYNKEGGWHSINLSLNSNKYWNKTITGWRLDFDQANKGTRFHVNHMLLQTTPRDFFPSTTEGWTAIHSLTQPWWTNCCGWPGVLVTDQNGTDAHMVGEVYSSPMLGGHNDVVRVRVYPQNGTTANHDMKVYWNTTADTAFSESKSVGPINFTAQNSWIELTFQVGQNGNWPAKWIRQLRLDFDHNVNTQTRWIVDHIMVDHQ